jgi:hypothetical protein
MVATVAAPAWGRSFSAATHFRLSPAPVALLLLNLVDGLFTLTFLQCGLAEELNPLMRAAWLHSPLTFMLAKLTLVHLGLVLLCMHREQLASQRALRAGALLYGAIDTYHLCFLVHLLLQGVG